jgi:competence protein ComEC
MAAQVACTPVIAAFSGQVSVVAVAANLLAGPAVGPATVLGLAAGAVTLAWEGAGHVVGLAAGAMAWWIVTVARQGASLPGASAEWGSGPLAIVALAVLCLGFCLLAGRALARPRTSLVCLTVLGAWVLHPISWGWPPAGWVMVACDVGQGDALVLDAGDRAAVVVDAGPDPILIDRCLDRLGVATVPLVMLSHLHADHVDGLSGVLDGRDVGEIQIGPVVPDTMQRTDVLRVAASAGVPVTQAAYATSRSVGPLSWTVLGPVPGVASTEVSGTAQNNSSIVLMVSSRGIRLLLCGDVEPRAQQALLQWGPALRADVLKVPHHGSAHQDPAFLDAVDSPLALISVGAGNDYGHPSAQTIATLEADGARVLRTDEDGDLAVVVRDGELAVLSR